MLQHSDVIPGSAVQPPQTAMLVSFVQNLAWDDLDQEVRHAARRHLLDTVGVMISGCAGDVADRLDGILAAVRPAGTIPVPGRARRADMLDAAQIGGTGGHGIELDDGYRQGTVHPGVVVVPALLASAYGKGIGGTRLLEALVAGYETVIAISRTAHPALRLRGFHPTGTVGVFGATAATGKLAGLDADRLSSALGLAASSSAGLFAFLRGGGDVKRLHAGHAAREGLLATLLAQAGVCGPPDILEGSDGFLEAFAFGEAAPKAISLPPASPFGITDCYIKPYACCRHLQPAAEALMALRREHDLREKDVRAIRVETYGIAAKHAHTGWEDFASAQLSFPFIMALALRYGDIQLSHFSPSVRLDPAIAGICDRVSVVEDAEFDRLYPDHRPARVTLETSKGRLVREVPEALGSQLVPLDDAGVNRKFFQLSAPILGDERSRELCDALWAIADCNDISPVMDLFAQQV